LVGYTQGHPAPSLHAPPRTSGHLAAGRRQSPTRTRRAVAAKGVHSISTVVSSIQIFRSQISRKDVADLSRGCDCALTTGISAWKTLTAGRKSAPATHKEAQNQLFALSHALRSIAVEDDLENPDRSGDCEDNKRQFPKDSSNLYEHENSRNLHTMLENCEDVLERFRTLIEKSTSMGQNTDEKDPNRTAKWRGELKNNWREDDINPGHQSVRKFLAITQLRNFIARCLSLTRILAGRRRISTVRYLPSLS
jgi:hypothetical protein